MMIAGPAAAALASLSPSQLAFVHALPKAELHAHLNGSIPIATLQALAREYLANPDPAVPAPDSIHVDLQTLLDGPALDQLFDFFSLFPSIYAITSTPSALALATRAVLESFLSGPKPQCTYLELRTTPRETPHMSRLTYLRTVLAEIALFPAHQAALIVSLDRRMNEAVMAECLALAIQLKDEGLPVVGIDLCGDPRAGDVEVFKRYFDEAREAGLGVTLHVAETKLNTDEETRKFLEYKPNRLGHATFLNEEAKGIVLEEKICIEICLSSNLLCKTVSTIDAHHIRYYLKNDHPIAICTDDTLPFRTSLPAEYALLLAAAPLGLGLSQDEVSRMARMGLAARFSKLTI